MESTVNTPIESNTRLHGRWLTVARVAWMTAFIMLTFMYVLGFLAVHEALSIVCEAEPCTLRQQIRHTNAGDQVMDWGGPPEGYADPLRPDQVKVLEPLGLTLDQYGWLGALQLGIPALMYLLIAAGLFWWKSDDWMVLFMSTMVMTLPFVDMPLPYTVLVRQPIWQWIFIPADFVAVSSFFIFPLVFPTGQVLPRWARWKVLFDIAFAIYDTLSRNYILKLPPGWDFFPYIIISFVTNAYALSYRYFRVANPVERQQIKWVVVGVVGFVSIAIVNDRFVYYHPIIIDSARALIISAIPDTIYRVITLFIPVSIAISVMRYRLWDIDIFINRALVYGALTASVVGLYVLLVGWSSIGLQTRNDLAGSVFAILVIAFLFRPLHQRLQRIADHFVPVPQTASRLEQHEHQIAIPESQGTADTTVRGRWLLVARLAWVALFTVLTVLYALGFTEVREALSTVCEEESCTLDLQIQHTGAGERIMNFQGPPVGYADRLRPPQVKALETLGLTLDQYGWLGALQMGIPALVFLLIAAGLFWRKSDNWMALFVSVMVATTPLWAMPLPFTLAVRQPAWEWVVGLAFFVSQGSNLTFPLIFPTGQFVPRWTRWMLLVALVHAALWSFYRPLMEHPRADEFITVTILIIACISLYALFYRYFWVASPLERQQLKWILVGNAGFLGSALLVVLPLNELLISRAGSMDPAREIVLSAIIDTLSLATTLFSPVAIVIAVLRYRLWDIDIIINRTLVYGILSVGIVVTYILLVGALSVLSQTTGNLLISLLATGLIAFLFQPLRERLQGSVNRLLYGDRDDPYAALSRLGQRLKSTIIPEAVLPTVVTTVREALKLPYTAIYMKQQDNDYKIIAESASPSLRVENGKIRVPGMERVGQCVPIIYQGETLGCLVLGPRAPNEAFSSSDLRLVDDLAPQVGVAVHAMRLTSDLQRSREQLVLTREEERRRLRRDLHDGLGPNLASQGLKIAAVKQLVENNPSEAIRLLDQVMTQNQSTVEDVRHLIYGLRPPALDELGLVAAIRDHVAGMDGKSTLQIEITEPAGGSPALSAAAEVAAYRIVLEALTNVIRHAQAKHCAIRFSVSHNGARDVLAVEVEDDGRGMPEHSRAGVGLRSMRERAEELGGSCLIESGALSGTRILACLPMGELHGNLTRLER